MLPRQGELLQRDGQRLLRRSVGLRRGPCAAPLLLHLLRLAESPHDILAPASRRRRRAPRRLLCRRAARWRHHGLGGHKRRALGRAQLV